MRHLSPAHGHRSARVAIALVATVLLAGLIHHPGAEAGEDVPSGTMVDPGEDLAPDAPAAAPVAGKTVRVTYSTDGGPLMPLDAETEHVVVSEHGRFVAFDSEAINLVTGGPHANAERSVYVVDRLLGVTQMVSVSSGENKANGFSWEPSISDDGRRVAFYSEATNLVPGDTNGVGDVFVRDLVDGTTQRVSVTSSEAQLSEYSEHADISGNGNVVAFTTDSVAVVVDDNDLRDIYVRDIGAGTTGRVSIPTANVDTNGYSDNASLDRDGSIVAFESAATNMVPSDNNGFVDLFVRDRTAATTERISVASNEGQGDNGLSEWADVSSSGRWVAFHSAATDIVPGAGSSTYVLVVRDRQAGTTELQSHDPDGVTPALRAFNPTISANGSRVAYMARASSILAGATCEPFGVIRDRPVATNFRTFPVFPGSGSNCGGRRGTISPDGRYVATIDPPILLAPDPTDTDAHDVYIRVLANTTFSDVPVANAFFEDISWLVDTGVTTGFPGGVFKPADSVTRGAMAAFLYRYTGASTVPPAMPTFSDVPTTNTFYKEIEWMVDEGYTSGFPGGVFKPGDPVSREGMAAFMYRLAGQPAFTPPATPTFNDVGTTHTFRKEIEWMASRGLASGFNDGGFHPTEPIARQATAAFLFRYERVVG